MRKRSLTKQVGVVMTDEMYDSLIKITDQMEVPVSEFIRGILVDALQQIKKEEHSNE
jgi:hypothetical protein